MFLSAFRKFINLRTLILLRGICPAQYWRGNSQGLGSRQMATVEKTAVVKPVRRNIKPLTEKIHASEPGEPPGGRKIPHKREGIPADFQSKIFYWDVIQDHNCFLREGQV